jgi:hypothetical protein
VPRRQPRRTKSAIEPRKEADLWSAKQRSRERHKLLGLILIALLILVIALARFGKTIPWGAR